MTFLFLFFIRYDDVILKIQECEATLASATDKGQQIAAEGSVVDRNNVTEQLQSLKQQLQALRRAVETQREQHELAAAEHRRLADELADILDWFESKEKEVKSRPLLERDPASVETELKKHHALCADVNEHLDRIRKLKESVRHEEGMPGSLKEMLSEATSLLTSLPREMEERGNYLESNMQMRLDYASLTDKLNSWAREAEIRLESNKEGLDFENILSDLEEHKVRRFLSFSPDIYSFLQTRYNLMYCGSLIRSTSAPSLRYANSSRSRYNKRPTRSGRPWTVTSKRN